jgi:hypothetical protein
MTHWSFLVVLIFSLPTSRALELPSGAHLFFTHQQGLGPGPFLD